MGCLLPLERGSSASGPSHATTNDTCGQHSFFTTTAQKTTKQKPNPQTIQILHINRNKHGAQCTSRTWLTGAVHTTWTRVDDEVPLLPRACVLASVPYRVNVAFHSAIQPRPVSPVRVGGKWVCLAGIQPRSVGLYVRVCVRKSQLLLRPLIAEWV